MKSPVPEDERLSPQEVDARLRAFTAADWAKARSLARLAAAGLLGWSGDDLLTEALTRLQEGRRVWRRDVHALVTLKMIMRSIADDAFKKQKYGPIDARVSVSTDVVADEAADGPVVEALSDQSPEREVDSRSQLEYLEKLVEDDEDCWCLVQLWAEGSRGQEAADQLGWDPKKHDAVRQRLLRRLQPLQDLRKS